MNTEKLLNNICEVLDNKKAINIQIINLNELTIIADYFVICTARSTTHVKSLSDNLEEEISKLGINPIRLDGRQEGKWAVIDYGDIIVHVMHEEARQLYDLELLWGNGSNIKKFN